MTGKTAGKSGPKRADATTGPGAPHPLDAWLRRELQGPQGGSVPEPLPPGIADLARRLEEKLGDAGANGAGDRKEPAAGEERPEPATGGKGPATKE
ncbi:MAG: hypothetical protein ACQEUZ_04445 [Pseudomonadota bacterium]